MPSAKANIRHLSYGYWQIDIYKLMLSWDGMPLYTRTETIYATNERQARSLAKSAIN